MSQEILQEVLGEIKSVNTRLDGMEQRFDDIDQRLDAVYNQTANLLEFKVEVNTKLDNIGDKIEDIEAVTKQNTYDIARLKSLR